MQQHCCALAAGLLLAVSTWRFVVIGGTRTAITGCRKYRALWIERLHAAGLRAPGGRKPGRWWRRATSEHEVLMRKIEDAIEGLPARPDRPIEELTVPELLVENVREGLLQSHRILSHPMKLKQNVDDELSTSDIRLQRVISDTAAGKSWQRASRSPVGRRACDHRRYGGGAARRFRFSQVKRPTAI